MLIGAHVPTLGGYDKMGAYAQSVGAECIQMFAKSPRQWNAKPIDPSAGALMEEVRERYGIGSVLTHTAYLINLTTTNEELWEKSVYALADELVRGSVLGAEGVNTHLGNVPDGDIDAALSRCAVAIDRAFTIASTTVDVTTKLILENTAGAGSTFGGPVEQLCEIIQLAPVDNSHLGICIDSCHAWAYGYDVSSATGWQEIADLINKSVGLDMWQFVHANDSKFEIGQHKDRHEWIGRGHIGLDGFEALLRLEGLDHLSLCTEMPGEMPDKDIVNINTLKDIRAAITA